MTRTFLFVDADNQVPTLAPALSRFLKTIAGQCERAIVAGNAMGERVRNWESKLAEHFPGVEINCHLAPIRKQSADVRLMFELARFFHDQPDSAILLVILSRDDLLVAAAECLVQRGQNVMVVVGATANGNSLVTDVPVVVLATSQQAAVHAMTDSVPKAVVKENAPKSERQIVQEAITEIRAKLTLNAKGGYAASAVGQVLAQLGHDKKARMSIVKQLPNLREIGTGPEKRLIF